MRIRIIAVSKICTGHGLHQNQEDFCQEELEQAKAEKAAYFLARVAIGSESRPEAHALSPHDKLLIPMACHRSGSSAELSDSERECRVLRHSSVRVLHADHMTRREKGEVDKHQTCISGHSRAGLRSWDGRMRVELGHQCAIPSTTSIRRTDTFGKAENQAKRERRSAGGAQQPMSYRTADTQSTRARTENSRGQHHAGKTTSTPIFFVVTVGVVVDEFVVVEQSWKWTEN